MSTPTLSSAAVHVVGQYHDAARALVGAWRASAHRLLDGAATGSARVLGDRLSDAQRRSHAFLVQRVDIDGGRVAAVMDRVAEGTRAGIERVAGAAGRVESPLGRSVLASLGVVHMPLAQVSVQIADRVAAVAQRVERRVAGQAPVPRKSRSARRAPAKPVARRAATARRRAA